MKDFLRLSLLGVGLLSCYQTAQADPITFTITRIDVPGSASTTANGINNASQIVGSYTDSAGTPHGFLDTNGTFTTLDFPGSTFTQATGINNVGQIVGFYSGGSFLYQNGTFSNLPIPAARYGFLSYQVAINDAGQIVGTAPYGRAFLYANSQLTFIPPLSTFSNGNAALSINNAGTIAGSVGGPGYEGESAFTFQNGQYTLYGNAQSAAYGINDAGDIVINASDNVLQMTYVIKDGVRSDLPAIEHSVTFPGLAYGLNDSDQVVGSLFGDVGFLATPVPEPASLLLFAGGLAAVCLLRQKSNL